eukprot:gnl/MRDRNA2_/MRDRNA2_66013_c0_seq3.p1 gnl/MRDRNA2_/MRDRNA2_66013_c0~~gnl/MRDRNA2_/MRDRNA2_66013_c0_seq3.p1  ORF type:complete len:263 (-),score=42.64 gnl/MRDRNA2_/MRDRNA2_66013_c0_seq3:10-798(-)
MNPQKADGYLAWGSLECQSSNLPQCSELLTQGIKLSPDIDTNQNAYLKLGLAWKQQGSNEEALHSLNLALHVEPRSSQAARIGCIIGAFHMQVGIEGGGGWQGNIHGKQALDSFHEAIALDSFRRLDAAEQADCFKMLGTMYKYINELELSAKNLRTAFSLYPGDPQIMSPLVEVLEWMGDMTASKALIADGLSNGTWDHAEQTPTRFLKGVKGRPWPDVSQYRVISALITYIESKYTMIRNEAKGLLQLPGSAGFCHLRKV